MFVALSIHGESAGRMHATNSHCDDNAHSDRGGTLACSNEGDGGAGDTSSDGDTGSDAHTDTDVDTDLNVGGGLVWAKEAGELDAMDDGDCGYDISVLLDGSALVTGVFMNTAVFGRYEANETELKTHGGTDIFVVKYNANRTLTWVKRAGGPGSDWGKGIAPLSDGSVLVTGHIAESAKFGGGEANETRLSRFYGRATFGAGEANMTELVHWSGTNILVAKYTP